MSEKIKTSHQQNSLQTTVGRGAQSNVTGRFNAQQTEADLENYGWFDPEEEKSLLRTQFFTDTSQTIITSNDSPDLNFTYSVNTYRGCEHGCIYCYARPTHEYLNMSSGLDFESKIFVKHAAPELLRKKLLSKSWKGDMIFFSGITDCYQPAERKFELTRKCLQVLLDFKNPVGLITKNQLIRRDIDILKQMAEYNGVIVYISVTTLDLKTAQTMEPRTSVPLARLKTIEELAKANIPVGVNVAPIVPGLTDHEMPQILKAAADAGAKWAGYVPVRLPLSVAPLFEEWLSVHHPDRKNKIITAIKSIRDGKMNDPSFGSRMQGKGPRADLLANTFQLFTKKYNLNCEEFHVSKDSFKKVTEQISFDF